MANALFTGSGVALVTPFTRDGVDYDLMERLIERQLAAGTDALIVLGTTGEPCTMSDNERFETVRRAVRAVSGRVPVIAGAGSNDTRAAIDKGRMMCEAGANALLVVTPYYNKCTQRGLIAHYAAIADAVSRPLVMYNVPSRTGLNMLPETAAALSEHPRVLGLKEASPSIAQLAEDIRLCRDRLWVYAGNDDMALPALAVGARGVISVTANVVPERVKRLTACYFRSEMRCALDVSQRLARLNALLFSEVNPIPVKAALALMGYGDGRVRLPLTELTRENLSALEAEMRNLELI